MKGRTFEGRRELIEEIMEDALKKRIEMLGVWEEWEREGCCVSRVEKNKDEKNKEEIFEKRRKLKRTWDVRVKDLMMGEKRNTWRILERARIEREKNSL